MKNKAIAFVGNPNCGKTSLFNALSGLNQKVGNFPGVTVERKVAQVALGQERVSLIDLPGANSLYPTSEDEHVTFEVLHDIRHQDYPDQVVVVADATQLRRGLMLCTQVMDLGFPVVLVLSMMDLADQEGLHIDVMRLAAMLSIPVVPVSVKKGWGLDRLREVLAEPVQKSSRPVLHIPPGYRPALDSLREALGTDNDYRAYQALLQPASFPQLDPVLLQRLREAAQIDDENARKLIANELLVRLDRADEWIDLVQQDPPTFREQITERLDRVLTHRIWGYVIFLGILLMIFQSVFAWATVPMDWIETGVGWLQHLLTEYLPAGWLAELLVDGVIAGLGGIVVFVPQIAFLFLFITILEESGYMARVVFLMDRIMRPFGFSGKSIIPLMGGMACAIPSIMMSRGIANRTERLITILVTPLMSCSARIPVYTLLIAMFLPPDRILGIDQRGLFMTAIYLLGFVAALAVAWGFKKIFKYQSRGMFVMEMPSYRSPRWRNVGLTVYQKSSTFVIEAGKVIMVISLVLWVLVRFGPGDKMAAIEQEYSPRLAQASEAQQDSLAIAFESAKLNASYAASIGKFIEPVIEPLGYDWKIGISLITSFAAREVFVGTMSIIYQQQDPESLDDPDAGQRSLIDRLRQEKDPETGQPIYTAATVLSLIVFYALAMQCMSTLAVTRKEAGWKWAIVMLLYLTALAYLGSLVTYQLMA